MSLYRKLCTYFEKIIEEERLKKLFQNRKHADVIILLDWDSTKDSLKGNEPLSIMKDQLENWDPGVKHKRIAILEGGYSEWLNLYPQFVTNPDVKLPVTQENALNEILEEFEFPSIIDDGIINTNTSSVNKIASVVDKKSLKENQTTKDVIRDRNIIEPVNNSYDLGSSWRFSESLYDQKLVNPFAIENSSMERTRFKKKETSSQPKDLTTEKIYIPPKPTVDRSKKPASLIKSNTETKILALMEEMYLVKKSREDLDSKILILEKEWLESKLSGNKTAAELQFSKLQVNRKDLEILVSFSYNIHT